MVTMLWDRLEEVISGCRMIADLDPINAGPRRRLNHTE